MYCWLLSGQVSISCFGQNYVQDLDSLNYNQSDYLIVTCYTLNTFTAIFSSHHSASAQLNHKQVTEGSRYAPTTKQCSSPLTHFSEGNEATRWRRLSSYVWWAPLSWRYTYVHYMYTTVEPWLSEPHLSKPELFRDNFLLWQSTRWRIFSGSIVAVSTSLQPPWYLLLLV